MRTLLAYPSFRLAAGCLDTPRLLRQLRSHRLVLDVLWHGSSVATWQANRVWQTWLNYEDALHLWCMRLHCEGMRRRLSMPDYMAPYLRTASSEINTPPTMPQWYGESALHASHRSYLLRKDPAFYGRYGWADRTDLHYQWPTLLGV